VCVRERQMGGAEMKRERCVVRQITGWVVGQTHTISRCPVWKAYIPDI